MKKGNPWALLPIGVFLLLFIVYGVIVKDFYAMPAIVGFIIALIIAFLQCKNHSFTERLSIAAKGAGDENIIIMCMIFILAGAFTGSVKAAGGVASTVNFALSILPPSIVVVGLLIVGCFISISMGTSMGTIAALAPIAVGISEQTGLSVAICISAVVCGAMFGDNLSMVSDTTIAAVRTQGCEMKDKFRQNFLIVLPAIIITAFIFWFITKDVKYIVEYAPYNFVQIIPYLVVLIGASTGFNVFTVLLSGTMLSIAIGLYYQTFGALEIFKVIATGIESMYEITVISLVVACCISLVKANGGIDFILNAIKSKVNSKRGAAFGIAALASLVDVSTANNTVAIVIAGPIAKEIGDEFELEPKRVASLLDIFTSVFQGLIPYGAQLLSAATLTGITPYQIIPHLYYPILMAISAIIFIAFFMVKKDKPKTAKA